MGPEYLAMLIPITGILSGVVILYIVITNQNKERMAMIERGEVMDFSNKAQKKSDGTSLRNGMFMVGLGLGLLLGHLLMLLFEPGANHPLYHFVMVLIGGGLALVWFHNIQRKREAKM